MNTHTSKNHTSNMIRTPKENIPLGIPVKTEDGFHALEVKFNDRKEVISLDWFVTEWTRMRCSNHTA